MSGAEYVVIGLGAWVLICVSAIVLAVILAGYQHTVYVLSRAAYQRRDRRKRGYL